MNAPTRTRELAKPGHDVTILEARTDLALKYVKEFVLPVALSWGLRAVKEIEEG